MITPMIAKPKDTRIPMKENKLKKLKMAKNFIIRVNPSTSLLEMKVDMLNDNISSQED